MHVLTREEMYQIDRYTIDTIGIPGKVLMENAGRECFKKIQSEFLTALAKVALFCGSGNNGGDGFVIARYLKEKNYNPFLFFVGKEDKMTPETKDNFTKCKKLHIPIYHISSIKDWHKLDFSITDFDLVVDAIFGVGFKGVIRGWISKLILEINQINVPKVAIDISSGVDANTGQAEIAIKADKTYTMAAIKQGELIESGRVHCGDVEVIDIGVPQKVFEKFSLNGKLINDENVKYPNRFRNSHKGDYGKIGIIAGSPGFSGAAILASRAALRSGGGLITLFHPKGMEMIFEIQLIEVMTQAIPEIDMSYDWENLKNKIDKLDVLLIGPGLGTSTKVIDLLTKISLHWEKPLVIDADGINCIAKDPSILGNLQNKKVLLTPHIGEFSRIIAKSIHEISNNPIYFLKTFASDYNISVLLKSATTIFSDGNCLLFDTSGNDGLSTGGSGDVLSGIIISFLAQKMSFQDAAIGASYLLGKTAEKVSLSRCTPSIIPSDIIENLFVR